MRRAFTHARSFRRISPVSISSFFYFSSTYEDKLHRVHKFSSSQISGKLRAPELNELSFNHTSRDGVAEAEGQQQLWLFDFAKISLQQPGS